MKILKKISGKVQFIFIQVFRRPFPLFLQIVDQKLFDVYRNFFKVRVFECFIFHNELDILKLRIDYLKDTVDFFVIVE